MALVVLFELAVEFLFKDDKKKSVVRSIGRAVFISGLAALFHLTLQNAHTLESIDNELIGVNEKATAFEFFKPYETIQKLEEKNTFGKLLKSQMDHVKDRLKQIEQGELRLSREEVIPIWEDLISKYTSTVINATNVVSINDWEKFSPNQGIEAHEEALGKEIKFKRLFIYDISDSLSVQGTKELATRHVKLKIDVRLIDKFKIDNTTYGNTMYSNFGTLDIVIFDNECLLQTITQYKNKSYEIVNGVVTNNKTKIQVANEMFGKLWEKGEKLEDFLKKHK